MDDIDASLILRRRLCPEPAARFIDTGQSAIDRAFLRQHYGWMVWSNPLAPDSVLRLKILMEGSFFDLVNLAKVYGVQSLRDDLQTIQHFDELQSNPKRLNRLEGIISSIERGAHASEGNQRALESHS